MEARIPNSISLPWRRIAAEGAVIVASILLALAADAWWTRNQEAAEAGHYLARLLVDIDNDMDSWSEHLATSEVKLAALDNARVWIRSPTYDSASLNDFLDDLTQGARMAYGVTVSPDRTTFDELLYSGQLHLLRPEVRRALVDYYNTAQTQRDRLASRETEYAPTIYALLPRDPEFAVRPDLSPAERRRIAERALAADLEGVITAEWNHGRLVREALKQISASAESLREALSTEIR